METVDTNQSGIDQSGQAARGPGKELSEAARFWRAWLLGWTCAVTVMALIYILMRWL
jgi:hypothetical protein